MVIGSDAARVLVVGSGFAGVAATNRLAGEPRAHVTLLDRSNHRAAELLDTSTVDTQRIKWKRGS
jgi:NADH dehydrogenase FAD-containing subunit